MLKHKFWIGLILIVALASFWAFQKMRHPTGDSVPARLIAPANNPEGFARATTPRVWDFPSDYGPHPDYQTEWWYYTGNLQSETGERFGYQLTFFRRALLPAPDRAVRPSAWAADQVYMAHFALSEITAGEHQAFERFSRGAAGLAGAQSDPYRVWLENWEVHQTAENQFRLSGQQGEIFLDLILEDSKGPILHGDSGYSQKGPETGNASYYYSQTRLRTTGRIETARGVHTVNGWSWKDHEFSTSALSEGQVGWDWFSLQLDDGSEVMFFQIRRADGSIDPFSSGTWISPEGETVHLERDHFEIEVQDTWRSPHSGVEYPAAWRVSIPSLELSLNIWPYLADQEMNLSYIYWEGAVTASGYRADTPVAGSGYVEMSGYAASMEEEF